MALPRFKRAFLGLLIAWLAATPAAAHPAKATETLLWSFGGAQDGSEPEAGLIADASGALYGTTALGGAYGFTGSVFKLTPLGSTYSEQVIWSFGQGHDGVDPLSGLLSGADGALFGTTTGGGTFGGGVVFALTPSGSAYSETVLYNFCSRGSSCRDGSYPEAGLIGDGTGALYGTTGLGGAFGYGTVFKLTPHGTGYVESVLHSFCRHGSPCNDDGAAPEGGVIADGSGALFGTTVAGGAYCPPTSEMFGCGTVFKLTPHGNRYDESVLWSFGNGSDGIAPQSSLIMDASGALYGTTSAGGRFGQGGRCCGTVFKLTRGRNAYSERVVWNFGRDKDGQTPVGGLISASGALYGTTARGGEALNCGFPNGREGCGTVFELRPLGSRYEEHIIYNFCSGDRRSCRKRIGDGSAPVGSLIFDRTGALFGTTAEGGANNSGTVFRLIP